MFAVLSKRSGIRFTILHTDVVELKGEERHLGTPKYRQFKCKCCGSEWIENINSPLIIDDETANNINQYYDNVITCDKW